MSLCKENRFKEDILWERLLNRLDLNKPPREIENHEDKRMQYFILTMLSDDPYNLPKCRYEWEEWYLHYLNSDFDLFEGIE